MVTFKPAPGSCAGGDCCDPGCNGPHECDDGEGNIIEQSFNQFTVTLNLPSTTWYGGYEVDSGRKYFFSFMNLDDFNGDYIVENVLGVDGCEWIPSDENFATHVWTPQIWWEFGDCSASATLERTVNSKSSGIVFRYNPTTRVLTGELSLSVTFFDSNYPSGKTLLETVYITSNTDDILCDGGDMELSSARPYPDGAGICAAYPAPSGIGATYVHN